MDELGHLCWPIVHSSLCRARVPTAEWDGYTISGNKKNEGKNTKSGKKFRLSFLRFAIDFVQTIMFFYVSVDFTSIIPLSLHTAYSAPCSCTCRVRNVFVSATTTKTTVGLCSA